MAPADAKRVRRNIFCLLKGRYVNTFAGYAVCAGLQPVLAYAPRYPAACGGNATESWRNRHIAFRESNKKPGRAAGFKFARKELPCFDLSIWR
jgi:hypothetical protein